MVDVMMIGCGNMGSALLKPIVRCKDINRILVIEKREDKKNQIKNMFPDDVEIFDSIQEFKSGLLIIAVKPQDVPKIMPVMKQRIGRQVTILSIAAGITRSYYRTALGIDSIIRAMPNTPGLLGVGITGVVYDDEVRYGDIAIKILEGLGDVVKVEREEDIDTITAISGSGPAYFFFLSQMLKEFGCEMGLNEEVARRLARRTAYGAGVLLEQMEASCEELRKMVTSPGGTTEAAIKYMTEHKIDDILKSAFLQAKKRAKELSM